MVCFDKLIERIHVLARQLSAAFERITQTVPPLVTACSNIEEATMLDNIVDRSNGHIKAGIRLVAAVFLHRFLPVMRLRGSCSSMPLTSLNTLANAPLHNFLNIRRLNKVISRSSCVNSGWRSARRLHRGNSGQTGNNGPCRQASAAVYRSAGSEVKHSNHPGAAGWALKSPWHLPGWTWSGWVFQTP